MSLLLIVVCFIAVITAGCTDSSVQTPSGTVLNGTYSNGVQSPIITFEPDGIIGYIGVNGIKDVQFYGGRYQINGNAITVSLTDKQVGSGAFQKLDQPIKLELKYIDDVHIGTPDGYEVMKEDNS